MTLQIKVIEYKPELQLEQESWHHFESLVKFPLSSKAILWSFHTLTNSSGARFQIHLKTHHHIFWHLSSTFHSSLGRNCFGSTELARPGIELGPIMMPGGTLASYLSDAHSNLVLF